jgi:RNA polymerase sigma-70 factor (ECF subfamily)
MSEEIATEFEKYRAELRVHCYRLVGSFDEAEDLVQDAMLQAWRRQDQLESPENLRAWLYRIATNTCLDFLRRVQRRPRPYEPIPGMAHGDGPVPDRMEWLQPFPTRLAADQPEDAVVGRETIELVFIAAMQHLPARQRVVFVARELLGWSAAETADALDMTVAGVNSTLQRAKPALRRHLPPDRASWTSGAGPGSAGWEPTAVEKTILDAYVAAVSSSDVDAMGELLSRDIVLTMPPHPFWFSGLDAMVAFVRPSVDPSSPTRLGDWRSLPTSANGMPAAADYVRLPGTTVYRAQVLDVLRVEGGKVVEITSFEPHHFVPLGLPLTLR